MFKDRPREFSPGDRYQYSNSGYYLLGRIVERESGLPLGRFMRERIFEPLGMRSTALDGDRDSSLNPAQGYFRRPPGGYFSQVADFSSDWPQGAGGLISTVSDLARWNAAVVDGKLLDASRWKRVFAPAGGTDQGYGYGWDIGSMMGRRAYVHAGGIDGFASLGVYLPEEDLYVAVLHNAVGSTISPGTVVANVLQSLIKPR